MTRGSGLVVGQSWLDRERAWLDLYEQRTLRTAGELRVQFLRRPRGATLASGTLARNKRTYRVYCEDN